MTCIERLDPQRGEELRAKHRIAFKEVLGDREEEVIHLQVLATNPEKQGHGYGSALVRTVTGIVSRLDIERDLC
jgi:GNAT superfamily N-acetyltransferase